jgi:uncharacterized oxidoreductase
MQLRDNTILITGGRRGIGRGLAEAFYAEGNQVIIAGRGKKAMEETVSANPGMKAAVVDMADGDSIVRLAEQMKRDYPALNAVILNAGIMRTELLQSGGLADAEAIVATNLLGPVRLIAALLPMLLSKPRSAIMTVSSGLAFVPLAVTPTYCATKAAIHSYTQSLRYQLRHTSVEVLELVPPYVQTELLGPGQLTDPNALPLKDFISEAMHILKHSAEVTEICVERVESLRRAEASGSYDTFYKTFNDRAASAHETL